MNNTIIFKNGKGKPTSSNLQESELGFDIINKLLYVGIASNDAQEQTEVFCLNPWESIDKDAIAFDVKQSYIELLF